MNKPWVRFHLNESIGELQKVIEAIDGRTSFSTEEFEIAIAHAYHHLNTAWNSRSISDQEAREHTDWDYSTWRQFPTDLNLS